MTPLERMREFLIQKGVDPKELDDIKVPKVLDDFGNTLATTLENDTQIGYMFAEAMQLIEDLATQVVMLEQRVSELEGGI